MILNISEMSVEELDYSLAIALGYPSISVAALMKKYAYLNSPIWCPSTIISILNNIMNKKNIVYGGSSNQGFYVGDLGSRGPFADRHKGTITAGVTRALIQHLLKTTVIDLPDAFPKEWDKVSSL